MSFWNIHTRIFDSNNPAVSLRHNQNTSGRHLSRSDALKSPSAPIADSAENKKAMEAFSKSQRGRILANLLPVSKGKDTRDEMQKSLLGQAIRPEVAEKYMNSVEFDGIGRICGFKKSLSPTAFRELQSAAIVSLTQTNTIDERADARPGGDCMIQFMHLLQNVKGGAAQELLMEAKNQWMSGNLSDDAVSSFFAGAAGKLADMPSLQAIAIELSKAAGKTKELTQHNDNMYGRKFDSEFVHALIKSPPPATLEASRKMGRAFLAAFDKEARSNASLDLKKLAESMNPRPWMNEAPDLKNFMKEPTDKNLKAMLLNVNHGFDILKVQYLVSTVSKSFSHDISWKETADQRYESLQLKRSTRPFQEIGEEKDSDGLGLQMRTNGYGIGLANHPDYEKQDTFESAKNMTYHRMIPDMNQATEAEKHNLRHGHATVTGLSGSTNLLASLSQDIAKNDKYFSKEQAMLASMMFLVFDGGHALNEVMKVHTAIVESENAAFSEEEEAQQKFREVQNNLLANKAPPDVAKRIAQGAVNDAIFNAKKKAFIAHLNNNYHLDYRTIIELAEHGGSGKEVNAAMDTALGKTIDYFERNSYYMSRNEDLLGNVHKTSSR